MSSPLFIMEGWDRIILLYRVIVRGSENTRIENDLYIQQSPHVWKNQIRAVLVSLAEMLPPCHHVRVHPGLVVNPPVSLDNCATPREMAACRRA